MRLSKRQRDADRTWFPSARAARRDGPALAWLSGTTLVLAEAAPSVGPGATYAVGYVDVPGRSAAHIDRLARDWIGHGIMPTPDGRRAISDSRTFTDCSEIKDHDRWFAAKSRAARVVCR